MRLSLPALLLIASLAGWAMPAAAQKPKPITSFEGRVVRVLDGATLVVRLADKTEQTVRLRHIDPPESCQPGGEESMKALVDVALGKNVQVSSASRMPSGTLQAAVTLDTVDLSRRQVEEGQAWSLRFRYDTGPLVKEERMAKALKRGFHATGGAVMPKDFRERHGPCL
jgi:micrococcal nuclease